MKWIILTIAASTALLTLSANGSGELERYDKEGEVITFSQEELKNEEMDERRILPTREITDIFSAEGIAPSDLTSSTDATPLSKEKCELIHHIIEEDTRGLVEIINEELDTVLIDEEREFAYMLLGPYFFSATRSVG